MGSVDRHVTWQLCIQLAVLCSCMITGHPGCSDAALIIFSVEHIEPAGHAPAVCYLHKITPTHSDLHRDNVLLSKIEMGLPYVAKLVDFGISEAAGKPGTKSQLNTAAAGLSPAYASPEVIRMQTPTTKDDVYSFGILMWQLMTGKVRPLGTLCVSCRCRGGSSMPNTSFILQYACACSYAEQCCRSITRHTIIIAQVVSRLYVKSASIPAWLLSTMHLRHCSSLPYRLECIHLQVPFADLGNTMAVCEAVTKGIRPSLKDIEGDAGVFTDLIQACWQKSPEGRPSMSEVVAWLQELCKGIPIPLN